jgi:glutathione reductase (NADPH)
MSFDYDLFVIGAGSGGVRAARIAAGHGARVAIAEEHRVGGTCVIRGCVPKKLMVYAGRFADDFADAAAFGWRLDRPRFDWSAFIAAEGREIDRLEGAYRGNLERSGVEIFRTRAVIAGERRVRLVASGREVTAAHVLIATGATPVRDGGFPGCELAETSEELFHWPERPNRLLVIGGGYIAVEFASLFTALGTQTRLLYRGEEILRGFDGEVRRHLHGELAGRGVEIVTGDVVTRLRRSVDGLEATTAAGRVDSWDRVLLAIGRRPNTKGLGLERIGLDLGAKGEIPVTGVADTALAWLHAVGDVTDRVALTPVAIREGHAFADRLFGGLDTTVDHELIPSAVFATPEVGTVGASEEELRRAGRGYDVYRALFRPMRGVFAGRPGRTLMKVLVDAADDRVVGVHVVGADAAEIVQSVAIAVRMGAKKRDFDATTALHPSAAEELVTLRTVADRWRP